MPQGLLQAFIDFIVERKIVHLEELASEFGLKVQVGRAHALHHLYIVLGSTHMLSNPG